MEIKGLDTAFEKKLLSNAKKKCKTIVLPEAGINEQVMIAGLTCAENKIPYEVVSPNVWRKYAGTCGKNRKEEKILSVSVVKNKYNINVSDDVAEAILIGQYGSRVHKKEYKMAFGKK